LVAKWQQQHVSKVREHGASLGWRAPWSWINHGQYNSRKGKRLVEGVMQQVSSNHFYERSKIPKKVISEAAILEEVIN
jgi:hypothetical protein